MNKEKRGGGDKEERIYTVESICCVSHRTRGPNPNSISGSDQLSDPAICIYIYTLYSIHQYKEREPAKVSVSRTVLGSLDDCV
jgi:hypothetical protein